MVTLRGDVSAKPSAAKGAGSERRTDTAAGIMLAEPTLIEVTHGEAVSARHPRALRVVLPPRAASAPRYRTCSMNARSLGNIGRLPE